MVDCDALREGLAASEAASGASFISAFAERLGEGKVPFPVNATLTDAEEATVATASVQWHVPKSA